MHSTATDIECVCRFDVVEQQRWRGIRLRLNFYYRFRARKIIRIIREMLPRIQPSKTKIINFLSLVNGMKLSFSGRTLHE